MAHLYALDFDGVLCDSCGESSISALKAAKLKWPELFVDINADTEAWILESMHLVRPVVETGYENVLLVRLLLELKQSDGGKTAKAAEGVTVQGILENWEKLKPRLMEEWGETSRDALVELFGNVRDQWISYDISSWIQANRFYPGTADSLKFATSEVFVVTTKQARFAATLLKELAGVEIPMERIYGLGTGPKVEVLKQLQSRPEHKGMTFHFVEDRLSTLLNVIKEPQLHSWNLYLADWGYNTPKERDAAAAIPRIHMLDLGGFCSKLR